MKGNELVAEEGGGVLWGKHVVCSAVAIGGWTNSQTHTCLPATLDAESANFATLVSGQSVCSCPRATSSKFSMPSDQ